MEDDVKCLFGQSLSTGRRRKEEGGPDGNGETHTD